MRMTNNISTLIKGLVIAFAITLFIPSASHATWGKHTYNNYNNSYTTCTTHTNYKNLAEKYKKLYYSCYHYGYYRYYLYYINLYNQHSYCNACKYSSGHSSSNTCSKYKLIADKYLAYYNKCHNYCYYTYYLCYIKKYNKCQKKCAPAPAVGSVCGFVFEDSNDNGKYDKYTDKALSNVKVTVTDSKGNIQTVKTGTSGYYTAKNVATGTASVKIVESTLPSSTNVNQVVGSNPTNVTVRKNCEAWEEANGYTFGVKFGSICGFIFEDTDCDGKYNKWCDKALANVEVKVTDAEGNIQTVKTDKWGYYKANNIAVGTATVDIVESSLPDNLDKNIEVGTDPTDVEVEANCEAWEEKNGYCKVQVTTGKVSGVVYHDADGNGRQNGSEVGIAGIEVIITSEDTSVQPYKVTTDANGNYSNENVLAGAANVELNVSTLPTGYELTAGENPNTITVVAGGSVDAGKDGYTLIPTPLGSLSGVVDLDERHLKDVTVTITDSNGDEYTVTTNDLGEYRVDNLPLGSSTVIIDTSTIIYDDTTYLLVLDTGRTENTVEIEENENKVIYTKYTLTTL